MAAAGLLLALGPGCGPTGPERALERATRFFEQGVDAPDPTWNALFGYYRRRFGLEVKLASGELLGNPSPRPERTEQERIYDRAHDPGAAVPADWIAALPNVVDRIVANALHCDRIPIPEDWVDILGQASRKGGYALTHAVLATEWSLENGCIPPQSAVALHAEQVELLEALASDRAALLRDYETPIDLWVETLAMLHYADASDRVRPEWVDELVAQQLPDGGWRASPRHARSDPHTTALALWVLLENRTPPAPRVPWIVQARDEAS